MEKSYRWSSSVNVSQVNEQNLDTVLYIVFLLLSNYNMTLVLENEKLREVITLIKIFKKWVSEFVIAAGLAFWLFYRMHLLFTWIICLH